MNVNECGAPGETIVRLRGTAAEIESVLRLALIGMARETELDALPQFGGVDVETILARGRLHSELASAYQEAVLIVRKQGAK